MASSAFYIGRNIHTMLVGKWNRQSVRREREKYGFVSLSAKFIFFFTMQSLISRTSNAFNLMIHKYYYHLFFD